MPHLKLTIFSNTVDVVATRVVENKLANPISTHGGPITFGCQVV